MKDQKQKWNIHARQKTFQNNQRYTKILNECFMRKNFFVVNQNCLSSRRKMIFLVDIQPASLSSLHVLIINKQTCARRRRKWQERIGEERRIDIHWNEWIAKTVPWKNLINVNQHGFVRIFNNLSSDIGFLRHENIIFLSRRTFLIRGDDSWGSTRLQSNIYVWWIKFFGYERIRYS